jgi:hypothetical protein
MPEERGRHEDLTRGLRGEGRAPVEEIDAGGLRRRSGSGGRAALRKEKRRGGARDGEEVLLPLYRAEGEGEKAHKAVAWELAGRPLMAAAGGSVERLVREFREGRRRGRGSAVRGALKAAWWGGEEARGGRGRR